MDVKAAQVHTLRDGKAVRLDVYDDRREALTVVDLEEQAVSQENVEIVRQLIALGQQAYESGLPLPHTDLVTPDAEMDLSRRVFNPGIYRGFDGWARMIDEVREVWAEWQVTPERIIGVGDRVVSIEAVSGRGRGGGVETEARYASIWTLLKGRVTRMEIGLDPQEALKAVGLEEQAVSENLDLVRSIQPDWIRRARQSSAGLGARLSQALGVKMEV